MTIDGPLARQRLFDHGADLILRAWLQSDLDPIQPLVDETFQIRPSRMALALVDLFEAATNAEVAVTQASNGRCTHSRTTFLPDEGHISLIVKQAASILEILTSQAIRSFLAAP